MRKQKQLNKANPIQLSFNKKSHSINMKTKQEELFAPYKIQWKTPVNDVGLYGINQSVPLKQPFKNLQNQSGSRVFYQNMKNQLLNIKQDVEKLMMKQKTKDKNTHESLISRNDSHHNQASESSSGYIKTLNIKNKCQNKISKVQSLYENVNNVLSGKIGDSQNKLTFGESKIDTKNKIISNEFNQYKGSINNNNIETMYRSEKDTDARAKSKSIAENQLTKGIYFIDLNPNQNVQQNQEESSYQQAPKTSGRPKIELNIDLPSFQRLKLEQKKVIEQKTALIEKLKAQVNQLQKQLTEKNDKLSKQQKINSDLNTENLQLKSQINLLNQRNTQLEKQKGTNLNELNNFHGIVSQQENKIKFLELQLQKAITFIRQKEQQAFCLVKKINEQNNTILQLGSTCEQLGKQIKNSKQSSTDQKKLKEKLKLKQNQLYIYQQELKQAKLKIKELKQIYQEKSNNINSSLNQQKQSINDQQKLIDQTQQFKFQIKQHLKVIENLKSENQRLKSEIHSFKLMNDQNQIKFNQSFKQNCQLRQKINQLEKDAQKAFQQILKTQGFQNIGEQISKKMSVMVDQNYNLKNKISHLESTLEELSLKNRSLSQEVKIYEQKVSLQGNCTRRLKIEDWDNLTEQRDRLKSELQKVQQRLQQTKEFYEVETMRKQNSISELRMQINNMLEEEDVKEQNFHTNIKCVKHIKNLDSLLKGFKQMIDENVAMKEQLESVKASHRL